MGSLWAFIVSIFKPVEEVVVTDISALASGAVSAAAKVGAVFAGIIAAQPAKQSQILHDSMAAFSADIQAGKGLSTAAADALTTFYDEEKGEATADTHALFTAFLKSVGAS